MKKKLITSAIFLMLVSCFSACCHKMTEEEKAKFVAEYLESHYNSQKNKDFVMEKNFISIADPVVKKIINANDHVRGGGEPPSATNHSLFIRDSLANILITRFINDPYRLKGVKSYKISVDSLQLYIDYAKAQGTPLTYFRMLHGTFDSAGYQVPTLVFAGLDKDNKYVLYTGMTVLEHCLPCPDQCPQYNGSDISDLIKN